MPRTPVKTPVKPQVKNSVKPAKKTVAKTPANTTPKVDIVPLVRRGMREIIPTPEEKAAKRGLDVSSEAGIHALAISRLTTPDVDIERAAIQFRKEVITAGIKEVHLAFDEIVKSTKASYDAARQKLADYLAPFDRADILLRDKLNDYYSLLKRLEREEQQKAEKEQAERERQAAIQREEERRRLEAETEQRLAELPDDAPEELIEKILAPLAEIEEPMQIAPPVRVSRPETSGGVTQQDNWSARIDDIRQVVAEVVAGRLPWSIVEIKLPEANKLAKLYRDQKSYPGMTFVNNPFVRGTGR